MDEQARKDNQQSQDTESAASTDNGTSAADSWLSDLPEPLKQSKSLAKFHDKASLAKSYIELESKLGKSVEIPGKEAKPEDWDRFYSRVGRPQTSDDYALEPIDGFNADSGLIKRLRSEFHAAGLSPAQADRIYKRVASESVASLRAMNEAEAQDQRAQEARLREVWGQKFDEKMELIRRFAVKVGGEEAAEYVKSLGIDEVVLKLLAEAGELTGAHKFVDGVSPKGTKPVPYAYMNEGR